MVSQLTDYPQILRLATQPKGLIILSISILCAILIFNSFFYIFHPYDGMGVYQEAPLGEVYEVVPGGPAENAGILVGDQILAIDGKRINPLRSEPRYRPGIKAGDTISYDIKRGTEQIVRSIIIGDNFSNLPLLGTYLGIQFLSIGLWAIGLVLALFVPADDMRARLLSLGFVTAGPDCCRRRSQWLEQFLGGKYHPKDAPVFACPNHCHRTPDFPNNSFASFIVNRL